MENNNISDVDPQPSPSISIGSDKENTPEVECGWEEEEGEEIVVEYTHNDYVDLVGPLWYPLAPSIPAVSSTKAQKKPGALPPFALYLQEQRPRMQEEHPDMTFGEIGKRIGEMWHSLEVNYSVRLGTIELILCFSLRPRRCMLREPSRSQI